MDSQTRFWSEPLLVFLAFILSSIFELFKDFFLCFYIELSFSLNIRPFTQLWLKISLSVLVGWKKRGSSKTPCQTGVSEGQKGCNSAQQGGFWWEDKAGRRETQGKSCAITSSATLFYYSSLVSSSQFKEDERRRRLRSARVRKIALVSSLNEETPAAPPQVPREDADGGESREETRSERGGLKGGGDKEEGGEDEEEEATHVEELKAGELTTSGELESDSSFQNAKEEEIF